MAEVINISDSRHSKQTLATADTAVKYKQKTDTADKHN